MQNTLDPKFLLELSQLIPSGVLLDDYGDPVNIAIPRQYASMPNLSEIPGHTTHDLNKIKDYFTNLLNGSYRINKINELEDDNDVVNCDYCRGSCIGSYYRCTECDLNMCSLCYGETSEAIALQNGASHYHSRKDKLDKCRSHGDDILVKMPLDYEDNLCNVCAQCTLCKYSIKGSCFYTDINSAVFDEAGKLINVSFSVCYDCYTSDRRLSNQENFVELTKVDNIFVDREFGSLDCLSRVGFLFMKMKKTQLLS